MRKNMKLRRLAALFLGTAAALSFASSASALGTHTLYATMNGANEVPFNSSGGGGTCTVTLDDVTGAVSVTGSFTGLTSTATAAHIHGLAGPGVNAGIIVGLTETGGTSGSVGGGGTLTPGEITGMLNGLTYINIHTTSNPGGEIRGQVLAAVPALPWSYAVVLAVLALVGGAFVLTRRSVPAVS
jgi:hypothetical protein